MREKTPPSFRSESKEGGNLPPLETMLRPPLKVRYANEAIDIPRPYLFRARLCYDTFFILCQLAPEQTQLFS